MTRPRTLRLRVVTPTGDVVDAEVGKVTAEAADGSFTLLPRHIDMVAALVPGLLVYVPAGEGGTPQPDERLLAVDTGTLVKCGSEVLVATEGAIPGDDVLSLQRELRRSFLDVDERERRSRTALARMESDMTRRLIELDTDVI